MARKLILLLFVCHSALTFYVFRTANFFDVFPPFRELATYQIFSDLAVSLSLVFIFLYFEAQRRRKPIRPLVAYGMLTILVGSFAPLIYLIRNKDLFDRP